MRTEHALSAATDAATDWHRQTPGSAGQQPVEEIFGVCFGSLFSGYEIGGCDKQEAPWGHDV